MPRLVRTPEVVELRSFCVAAESGSLGRAALRLSVSQPALTRRLRGLEQLAGVQLLERSPRGVTLTPAGRRLYEEARGLLEQADRIEQVLVGLHGRAAPVRLIASHSATEAFVAAALATAADGNAPPVELMTANSQIVRRLVGEGLADVGVAASRPSGTPNPAVREEHLAVDEVVCAVPGGHVWAQRRRVTQQEFLRTPMVVRDPSSNARWTVDAELRARQLDPVAPLFEAPTPAAAQRQALVLNAPVLLSRHVLDRSTFVVVAVDGLAFPRHYQLVLPAVGDPPDAVRALAARLRDAEAALA